MNDYFSIIFYYQLFKAERQHMKDVKDICMAIKNSSLKLLQESIEDHASLRMIPVNFSVEIYEYNPNTNLYDKKIINLHGKSYFHLVAFSGNLEILYEVHSKLSIPIIPVDLNTLKSNNPFQYLWSHGKYELLIYCMSMCEHTSYKNVLSELNIDDSIPYGKHATKPPKVIINDDIYHQQVDALHQHNWEAICEAINSNTLMIPINTLITFEKKGLLSFITTCRETLQHKYAKLKSLALHEKRAKESIKTNIVVNTTKPKEHSFFTTGKIFTAVLVTAGIFYLRSGNGTPPSLDNSESFKQI